MTVIGLLGGMVLAGCSSLSSSGTHRPDPVSVPCTFIGAPRVENPPPPEFKGVRGCTATVSVFCSVPHSDLQPITITATLSFDGNQTIGATSMRSPGSADLTFTIPFGLSASDGPHRLVRTCGEPSPSGPVDYVFTLVTERLSVSPTSAKIGDSIVLSATGLDCVDPHSNSPSSVVFEWDDAPSGTDARLRTVPAPAAYGSVPSVNVVAPENAAPASTVSLRCQFDPAGSRRATAAVQVASPYSLVLSPLKLNVGEQETVSVTGLNCAGGTPATAVVLDEGVKVAEFPAPDAAAHKVSFTVDRSGTHHIGVRCSWQKSVRSDLSGTFTAGPPPVQQTLTPSSGPVGIDLDYTVRGVTCPSGTPLQLVWDGKLVLDSVADATSITKTQAFRQRVPQSADGNHTVGVRCGADGQLLAEPQTFAVTSQPNLAVDPPRALPGDAIGARSTGFNCINPTPDYNSTVVYLLDNVALGQFPVVPRSTTPGRHLLVAQCDWPKVDAAHQRSRTFWVPGITLAPDYGPPGAEVRVDLVGYDCPTATIYFGGSIVANAAIGGNDGRGSMAVKPPADLASGRVFVGAECPNPTVRPEAPYQLLAVSVTASPNPSASDAALAGGDTGGSILPELLGAILALLAVAAVGIYLTVRARGRGPRGPRGRPPGVHVQLELGLPRLQVHERR